MRGKVERDARDRWCMQSKLAAEAVLPTREERDERAMRELEPMRDDELRRRVEATILGRKPCRVVSVRNLYEGCADV